MNWYGNRRPSERPVQLLDAFFQVHVHVSDTHVIVAPYADYLHRCCSIPLWELACDIPATRQGQGSAWPEW